LKVHTNYAWNEAVLEVPAGEHSFKV